MDAPALSDWSPDWATIDEITFPCSRTARVQVAGIARGGEVECAGSSDGVESVGDNAVVERRFVEVIDVIDNDVAAITAEIKDVLREVRLPAKASGEKELSTWSKIMNDFQHGGPLPITQASLAWQDSNRSEIAG